jgi:hypothetical protein
MAVVVMLATAQVRMTAMNATTMVETGMAQEVFFANYRK